MRGKPGSTTEYCEKIHEGRGLVVIFTSLKGPVEFITEHAVEQTVWATPGLSVTFDERGRAILRADFAGRGARFAFFGAKA